MSSDSYLKSLKDRLKSLDTKRAEKKFKKWAFNYKVNTKENKTSYELRNDFSTFVFEDNKEVSYSNTIDKDITLTVPANISQGFISMLTIYNMTVSKTITINNLSSYTLRIVNGSEYIEDNTYSTSSEGKKIIFARCDGLNIEILIIEEVPAIW